MTATLRQPPTPNPPARRGTSEEIQAEAETPRRLTLAEARPAAEAYKLLYFDNDFSYLDDPRNREFYLGDYFKHLPIGRRGMLDLGGEYRLRDHHEVNLRERNLSGLSDDFLLQRTRFYGNLKLGEAVRLYGEGLDSAASFQRHRPLASEENGVEALNLFADGRLLDAERGEFWGRVGRQELAYGSYRLLAHSEFANILRTFDGAKLFWRGKRWDIDGFWARPVAFGQLPVGQLRPGQLDMTQQIYGLWGTYRPARETTGITAEAETPRRGMRIEQTFDFYYLGLSVYDAPISAAYRVNASFQTIGSRWQGRRENWLWELEGAYQFGRYGSGGQSAGMTVSGVGYEYARSKAKPRLWIYYDWASGDADPANGLHGTFNQIAALVAPLFWLYGSGGPPKHSRLEPVADGHAD